MNKTCYLQTDGRWARLPYPKKPWDIGNSGCGEVSIANIIICMEAYSKYTPKTIQPYCKQYAAPNGDGTYLSGIPAMMKHYGLTEVKECDTFPQLWKEMKKGGRACVLLMGSRPGGSKRVHWTSGGHFVCAIKYKKENGKHYLYVKDSYSTSKLRNKWISYEENIKGDCLRIWVGKFNGALTGEEPQTSVDTTKDTNTAQNGDKLVVDGIGGKATVKAMQKYFGVDVDGVISGQNKRQKEYYPALQAVKFGKDGSLVVKKLQRWLGLTTDGIIGKGTTAAWQRKLRDAGYLKKDEKIDGIFGVKSMKAWQKFLNDHGNEKPVYPPKKKKDKPSIVIDVSAFQDPIDWKKVKADGIEGVIVKCGYRGAEDGKLKQDSMFLRHIKGAHKAGLKVGIYMFTEGITPDEGKEEARYAVKMLKKADVPISYPIAVDTETVNVPKERARNLSVNRRTAVIRAFCKQIIALGYEPMIYASTSWLNNKLNMSKLPYDVWVAQYASSCEYKGKYIMWQYTSSGKVSGVKGNVDVNRCYLSDNYNPVINADDPAPVPTTPVQPAPPVADDKKGYDGTFPSLKIKKTNQEVIDDAVAWAKWIAHDNDFHYGACNQHDGSPKPKRNADKKMCSHHNGCYFCGTNKKMKSDAMTGKEKSYCCNPFLGAAWAHGGCVPKALSMCRKGDSWDFGTGGGSYHKSPLFDNLGKLAKSKLKKGDILCLPSHVKMYIGDGKCVEAGHRDDNVKGSDSWNDSIAIHKVGGYDRVYRFNGSVDTEMPIRFGEISDRVKRLQKFLKWCGYDVEPDRKFGEATLKAVKKFQKSQGLTADGIVGKDTIKAMKAYRK